MKSVQIGWVVVLFVGVLTASPAAAQTNVDLRVFLGQKQLDDNDWRPLEDQREYGIKVTLGPKTWPVRIAIDLLSSEDDSEFEGDAVNGETWELGLGVRKIWNRGRIHPFLGGGLALVSAEIRRRPEVAEDEGGGGWIDGGVF